MFGAWFPDFLDCVAAGKSQEDAIGRAERVLALRRWIAWAGQGKAVGELMPIERIVPPKGSDVVAYFIVPALDPRRSVGSASISICQRA